MPEFDLWPIGASITLMLVAYAAYAFWWLIQPNELHYTIPTTSLKVGQHDVILDTRLPTRHRLIVTRTAVDDMYVYTAYAERRTPNGYHNYAVDVDLKKPAVLELPPLSYPSWPALPDQKLTVTVIDNPCGDPRPQFGRFHLPEWRNA